MRNVVSTISARGRPCAASGGNSGTPSCASARAVALDRIRARPGVGPCASRRAPARAIRPWRSAGPQPAIHERGLAAAGRSDRRRESGVAASFVDHGVDLAFPAEEQILLVLPEGPGVPETGSSAREEPLRSCCRHRGRLLQEFRSARGSARLSNPSIRPGSSMSIMSCLSSVRGSAR